MAITERSTVVGVFEHREQAERALEELRRAGFDDDQMGFALRGGDVPDGIRETQADDDTGARAGEGAVTGMVTGGLIGGLLAAGASLLIPGVGPVIGGGILATVLGGAAAGAAAGGLLGALTGMGVPEEEARYYEREFEAGRTIMTVRAGERAGEAAGIMRRYGAYDVERSRTRADAEPSAVIDERRGTTLAEMPSTGTEPHARDMEQERVQAYAAHPQSAALSDTASAAAGALANRAQGAAATSATTRGPAGDHTTRGEPTTPVAGGAPGTPLQRHERSAEMITGTEEDRITAENRDATTEARRAVGSQGHEHEISPDAQGGVGRREQDEGQGMTGPPGRWPVRSDAPQAGKYVEGEEQIATPRAGVARGQTGSGRAGTENAPDAALGRPPYADPGEDLERVGATSGMAPASRMGWADASSAYRQRWQGRQGAAGGGWEEVEPGFRYGHEMASDPRYQGRHWSDVEPGLAGEYRSWSQRQGYRVPDGGWDRAREYAREAWEGVRGGASDERPHRQPGRAPGERGEPA